jgi:hypothetical protein
MGGALVRLDPAGCLEAIHYRHFDVHDNHVRPDLGGQFASLEAVFRSDGLVPQSLDKLADDTPDHGGIIDYEDDFQ